MQDFGIFKRPQFFEFGQFLLASGINGHYFADHFTKVLKNGLYESWNKEEYFYKNGTSWNSDNFSSQFFDT